jgi:PAS domain S-box-containing protein
MGVATFQDLFKGQMDYIFFFEGLAFFLVLAVCYLFRGDVYQRLQWRWFGGFALAQGMAAWLSLVAINISQPSYLSIISAALLIVSWIFLMEFGRSGMSRVRGQESGLWLLALLLMITALGGLRGWVGIEFVSHYTLGLIGGLWAAAALFSAGRQLPPQNRGSGQLASLSLGLFAVSTAFSPLQSTLFSTTWLNQDLLARFTGVPIQFFQGLLAFGMAAGIYGYLPWRQKEEEAQGTRYRSRYMFTMLATLSVILGLGSVLTLYLGDWANKQHDKIKAEVYEYAAIMVNRLNAEFKRLDDGAKALGETSWLALSVRTNREVDIDRVNGLLDRYKETMGASVCYLMDTTGKTIASSNRNDHDSFLGHNYGFRPYFKQAISGSFGRYFAVGVTSKVPGYYVSCPVRAPRGKITRGVAVIKVSMDKITEELKAAVQKGNSIMCLADPRGIVFLATNPDMIFKSLWPLDQQNPAELKEQYGKDRFAPIFPVKFEDGARVQLQGANYLVSHAGTIHAGWSIFFFRPVERLGMYRLGGILLACILALLALVSLSSNLYLKEYALSTSGRVKAILDAAPEAIAVIDPNTSQIKESNQFMAQFLGYTPQELRALRLDDLLDQQPQETHEQLLKIARQNDGAQQRWQFRHKDGNHLALDVIGVGLKQRGKDQALIFGREAIPLQPANPGFGTPGHFLLEYNPEAINSSGKLDEFNNILSSLILQTEMALDEQPNESSVCRNLQEMLESAIQAKNLIREIVSRSPQEIAKVAALRGEHLLLVDDEAQLCKLEEKLFRRLGYRVTAFTDSSSALEAFRRNPQEFDLVIADYSLPLISGLEMARELQRLRPDLPIILATSFGETERINEVRQMGIECLEKPVLGGDLDKIVRRLLKKHRKA